MAALLKFKGPFHSCDFVLKLVFNLGLGWVIVGVRLGLVVMVRVRVCEPEVTGNSSLSDVCFLECRAVRTGGLQWI